MFAGLRLSLLFVGIPTICALTSPGVARAADDPRAHDPIYRVTSPKGELRLVEKFAKIVELPGRIRTVFGFDQEVIKVTKVEGSATSIRVHAVAPGVTQLVLIDEKNIVHTLEVFVIGDVRHLQAYLKRLFPHASVEAVAIRDSVVLRGFVTQPEHITEMVEIAEQFYGKVLNHMKVGGVQQVLLKVRVMEVQRAKVRKLGFNFVQATNDGFLVSTPGQLTPLTALSAPFGGPPAVTVNPTSLTDPSIQFGLIGDHSAFQGFIEALKEESLLKILAEPELVTTNGRPSNMLAGGEFPILVPQSLGTVTIEWRQFGVRLEAVPIILGNGRVRLELQPEVSERDFTNAVQVNGFTVPGLTSRRVNTQVEMRFGETFMIAGLLSTRTTAETKKLPVLGDLPWIGAAFRRLRYQEGETELVILVTPELVSPMKADQVPPGGPGLFTDTPTDRELYGYGMIEVPSYGGRCIGCNTGGFPPPIIDYGYRGGSAAGVTNSSSPSSPFTVPAPAPGAETVVPRSGDYNDIAPRAPVKAPPVLKDNGATGKSTQNEQVKPLFGRLFKRGGARQAGYTYGSRRRTQPAPQQRVTPRTYVRENPSRSRTEQRDSRPGLIGPGSSETDAKYDPFAPRK